MTTTPDPADYPPPLDWRSSVIAIGKRILYHKDNNVRIGVVEDITLTKKNPAWRLKVRWTEDWNTWHSRGTRPPYPIISTSVRTDSITVWPEDTCTHTNIPATPPTTFSGTTAPQDTAPEPGSPSAATET